MKMTGFILAVLMMAGTSTAEGQLPGITLKNPEGKSIAVGELHNNGNPWIISFFALWCKPCLRELNAIQEVYGEWQTETGVKIVAVSIDEGHNSDKVGPAVNGFGWDYEILLDPNREFMRKMNVTTIPCLFILDGNNTVVMRKSSYTDGSEQELIEAVRKLIKKQ